ncbi:MAG TPA: TylF/MycF/NovP-related O-methyltransferase [Urbifossiella sp.]|nr:TylF/MycF/NovP-related O-methyltransferase [Urbifossiella sp.]
MDAPSPTHTTAGPPADFSAAAQVRFGAERQAADDPAGAERHYARALALIQGYPPARQKLRELSLLAHRQAGVRLAEGDTGGAVPLLVRTVELDPSNAEARAALAELIRARGRRDLTRQCFVYHDPVRGEQVYREAFLRTWEYVGAAGLLGEYLEFGVLAGFTARLNAEILRDLQMPRQLHLFDSFDGLPDYDSPVDATGYDVAGRDVWENKMRFGDDYVAALGEPIDRHVARGLWEVVSPDRVFVRRGFYSETLRRPVGVKAAVVHIDCDLYQSTREVLTRLYETDVFQDGCVLLFDDFNCFKASPYFGERRAFREFLQEQDRFEASPWFTYGFNGAAYFLHEKPVADR